MHPGHGPGLTNRRLGEIGGAEQVTLTESQVPSHNHKLRANSGEANTPNPANASLADTGTVRRYGPVSDLEPMSDASVEPAGAGQPHNNMQPFLTLNYIIAMVGIYPSRG